MSMLDGDQIDYCRECERLRAKLRDQEKSAQPALVVPEGVTIERDMMGAMHIKLGDFDFIQIQYQYPHTDNASTRQLAERIAAMLTAAAPAQGQQVECQECERLRGLAYVGEHYHDDYTYKAREGALLAERDQLRAELAALKAQQVGQEPVAEVAQREPYEDGSPNPCKELRWSLSNCEDDLPVGTKLYTAPQPAPAQDVAAIPGVLFDGHAVYQEVQRKRDGHNARTSPENVIDTLDAVVSLLRAAAHDKQSGEG